jgi:ribosomal protein S18 acetylase RimI-like enzyme
VIAVSPSVTVSPLSGNEAIDHVAALGALLHACIHAGASIGFVLPFTVAEGETYWRNKVLPRVRDGVVILLVARMHGRIAGSVQLDYDTPPNQPHRAEVRKLLVHPDCRRQGIAKALMAAIERWAAALGRSLLTLDTRTGDHAVPLYTALGYLTAGIIPGYCRDPFEAKLDPTTVMYKAL